MTTYLDNYRDPIYQTSFSDYYSGVGIVSQNNSYGTGSLLYDGKSLLTAAHLFDKYNRDNVKVYFDSPLGKISYNATVKLHEKYYYNSAYDLAIVTLEKNVLPDNQRYNIYRNDDELGKNFTMIGYGKHGSGNKGTLSQQEGLIKLKTGNKFDADLYVVDSKENMQLPFYPSKDVMLVADFDNGSYKNNTLRNILNIKDKGRGQYEGMLAPGDSGGPAFIGEDIAGIAFFSMSIRKTDINYKLDSSFGELGAWEKTSYHSEWIDKSVRETYKNVPTSMNEVKTIIVESHDEIVTTYFLLEFINDRNSINDNITLNYTTRDGTAIEGEDYIKTSGVITLYKDESSVLIPVEIIGDYKKEDNEVFYLDVTNPSHGSLGEDVITLTAVRTIVDNDYLI